MNFMYFVLIRFNTVKFQITNKMLEICILKALSQPKLFTDRLNGSIMDKPSNIVFFRRGQQKEYKIVIARVNRIWNELVLSGRRNVLQQLFLDSAHHKIASLLKCHWPSCHYWSLLRFKRLMPVKCFVEKNRYSSENNNASFIEYRLSKENIYFTKFTWYIGCTYAPGHNN